LLGTLLWKTDLTSWVNLGLKTKIISIQI